MIMFNTKVHSIGYLVTLNWKVCP